MDVEYLLLDTGIRFQVSDASIMNDLNKLARTPNT
jgi:hypothetical protein